MDSLEINNIKVMKANAIMKHSQLRKMSNLVRIIEICVLLVMVSPVSTKLPLAVKNSGKYFKDLVVVLVSPRFVFMIGNAIVAILFVRSAQDSTKKNQGKNFYEEFVEKCQRTKNTDNYQVENREKQSICEENVFSDGSHSAFKTKSYRRSRSEKFKRVGSDKSFRGLRRLETEKYRKSTNSGEGLVKHSYTEDNMSNEEFRRMIEAFIARQHKFLMEERIRCDLKVTQVLE